MFGRAAAHGQLSAASNSVAAAGLLVPAQRTVRLLPPPYFVALTRFWEHLGSSGRFRQDLHCNERRARVTLKRTDYSTEQNGTINTKTISSTADYAELQQDIDLIYSWSAANLMTFNVSKCKCMLVSRRRNTDCPPINLNLNDHQLYRECSNLKIFGLITIF